MPASIKPPNVDIGWKLEVGTTVTFLCAVIVIGLRSLARWKYSQRGWDDYLMVFALLQALIATIMDYVAVNNGMGRHTIYLTTKQAINQQYYSLLSQVFCVHALTFAKISIILSYTRVLRGSQNLSQKVQKYVLWILGALVFIVNTVVILTFYVGCTPNKKSWDPLVKGKCWPVRTKLIFIIFQGSFSAFSDFFLAFFPFLLLQRLQISQRTKAVVLTLMSLGAVTGIFAVIRTTQSAQQLHASPTALPDVSYSTVMGLTWSGMERNIAMIVGSAPPLRPLLQPAIRLASQTLGSSKFRSGSQTYAMSDGSKFRKISDNKSRQYSNTIVASSNRSGAPPTPNVYEEDIIPLHGREPV
ncbi:hypothetical protein B7494_g7401 [Chlorociboria aeruginascens]|nr:hypothetical protein B7494_g7401 [Chlorociboria aeruginascens]